MTSSSIDIGSLRLALAQLEEALNFWQQHDDASPLKRHLRAAVIQAFEYTYELSMRLLRRVLMSRMASDAVVADLSFNDMLRKSADAGLLTDPMVWRMWRELRNVTSHTYDEAKAQATAQQIGPFLADAHALLTALTHELSA